MAVAEAVMDDHYRAFAIGQPININRPTTPAVRVTDLSEGPVNPDPIHLDEDDELLEEFLSPRKLRAITGMENLDLVTFLDMQIDSAECSLGNFGMHLPNLRQLKLSNSIIPSIRDLGSALGSLEVLWMPRSCLECLDGMVTMSNLKELYIAYNEVSDVSPCGMLENLQILDLEGNLVEEMMTLAYLAMCPKLRRLTLEGNPICKTFTDESGSEDGYRQRVIQTLPQLEFLDDVRIGETASISGTANATLEFDEHWNYIDVVLKESGLLAESSLHQQRQQKLLEEQQTDATGDSGRPTSARKSVQSPSCRPSTSGLRPSSAARRLSTPRRPGSAAVSARMTNSSTSSSVSSARPMSGSSRPSTGRPVSSNSTGSREESMDLTDESELTAGVVVCGNISKALRRRREAVNDGDGPEMSIPTPRARPATALPGGLRQRPATAVPSRHIPIPRPDGMSGKAKVEVEEDEAFKCLMDELKDWRAQYEKSRSAIERARAPQILRINHDDEAVAVNSDEEVEDEEMVVEVKEEVSSPSRPSPPQSAQEPTSNPRLRRYRHTQPDSSHPSASIDTSTRLRRLEATKNPVVPAIGASAQPQRPMTAMPTVGGGRVRLSDLLPSKPHVQTDGVTPRRFIK